MANNRPKVSLFSQITSLLNRNQFKKLVNKHGSDHACKGNTAWNHLISMLFCQFSGSIGLRDIEHGLSSVCSDIGHLGMTKAVPRSSLSYQNQHRSWELFRDYYFVMLNNLSHTLRVKKHKVGLKINRKIYVLDATVITLCMDVFDWARYRKQKGAIKVHTVLDFDMDLPVFADVTEGRKHDLCVKGQLELPKGSVIVADRAYGDTSWFADLDSKGVYFVIRMKENLLTQEVESYDIADERADNLLSDKDILFLGQQTSKEWVKNLRVVRFLGRRGEEVTVATNNTQWSASTIQELYRNRWSIETFFKEVKQNLRIKSFVGTSYNAVMIQLWTAFITILILKYLKIKAQFSWHTSNLAQQIRTHLFVMMDLWQWLDHPVVRQAKKPPDCQPQLF